MGTLGNLLKVLAAVVMIIAVIAIGVFLFNSKIQFGSSGTSQAARTFMFTVHPGDTVENISQNLKTQGVIDSPFMFKLQLKMKGVEKDIKAGQFQLTTGMDSDKLIKALTTSPTELGVKFQVIEGMRIGEIDDKLSAQQIIDKDKFLQMAGTAAGSAQFQDDFLQASGRPADQGLEGYLFPDTYEIKQSGGDNSETVIKKMLGTLEEKFTPAMREAATAKQRNIHQILTIASIVQREGQAKTELPKIAAVFWNRIDQGMRLDADPTTQYAVAKPGSWWPNLDSLGINPNDVDNPYNTYRIPGMPPGPICNPGLGAIQAAVTPEQNNFLYFVAKNDGTGEHAFATTLDEHERNRVKYGNR